MAMLKKTTNHATELSCRCPLPAVNLLLFRNLTWSLITRSATGGTNILLIPQIWTTYYRQAQSGEMGIQ